MAAPDPFLDASTLADWAKRPDWADSELAESMLQVVSDWIRDRKPDIADEDSAAQIVVFEVTREALTYGKYSGLSSFDEEVGHRRKSGTIRFREIEQFITSRHHKMLGLGITARPRGHFKKCDY